MNPIIRMAAFSICLLLFSCGKETPHERFHSPGAYNDFIIQKVDRLTRAINDIYEETGKEKTSGEQLNYFYKTAEKTCKAVYAELDSLPAYKNNTKFKSSAMEAVKRMEKLLITACSNLIMDKIALLGERNNPQLEEKVSVEREFLIDMLQQHVKILNKKQEIYLQEFELEAKRQNP